MTTSSAAPPVTAGQFADLFETCKNWGRWGSDDHRGALNLLTPERTAAAAGLVRAGRTVSCAWPLDTQAGPDNPRPVQHFMTALADQRVGGTGDLSFICDYVGMEPHGDAHSHIDALCHVAYADRLYNGVPVADAVTSAGVTLQSMDVAAAGLVGRGVLLDIPRLRGAGWVEPGEALMTGELQAAEREQGVRLQPGDILLLRTGHARKRLEEGPWDAANAKAGLHVTAMPWLRERDIAAAGFDGDGDTVPSNCEGVTHPIHVLGVTAMGLFFMDSLYLEDLAAACARERRWEFLLTVAPLRLAGTGSPVNPIAVF